MNPFRVLLVTVLGCLSAAAGNSGTPLSDAGLAEVRFEQKPGSQISTGLRFKDETGSEVSLTQFFGSKPVILVFDYYECPMLCTLVLNGLVESLQDIRWTAGKEFEVISLSINPRETAELAAAKKRTYLKRYGREDAARGWHFLVGETEAIATVTGQCGFHFAYDPASKQYAHPSGFVVLTPQGKISRYFFGVTFPAQD